MEIHFKYILNSKLSHALYLFYEQKKQKSCHDGIVNWLSLTKCLICMFSDFHDYLEK